MNKQFLGTFLLGIIFASAVHSCNAQAQPPQAKIAIIDTGYDAKLALHKLKLCKTGHYDFMQNKEVVGSVHPHGTMVASIIAAALSDVNYCAVIYQVFAPNSDDTIKNSTRAFMKARAENFVAINASFQGIQHSYAELLSIARLPLATQIFAAAGNSNQSLDETCNVYPACYPLENIQAVGALSPDYTQKAQYSNYGAKVKLWYPGHLKFGERWEHGTSFAAPRALSDYVRSLQTP